jgi:hypothetical protein
MIVICGFALHNGQPQRLVYGHDSFGNLCGERNHKVLAGNLNSGLDLSNRSFLLYFDAGNDVALKLYGQ